MKKTLFYKEAESSKEVKGTLRQRQKTETYRLILATARNLFETEGYSKTTIRKIAAQAGIALGTLYKHFKQKSTVMAAVFCEDIGHVLDSSIANIPVDGTIIDKLIFLADGFITFYSQNPKLANVYLRHAAFVSWEETANLDKRFQETVVSLLEESKQNEEIRSDVDSQLLSFSFISNYFMAVGTVFLRQHSFSRESALELLRQMTELLFMGIITPEEQQIT